MIDVLEKTQPDIPKKSVRKTSMRTIAEKVGVSTTTVSLALRNDPSISEETKRRIFVAKQALGYQRGGYTHGIKIHDTALEQIIYHTVGVNIHEANYAPFLTGLNNACQKNGLRLELKNTAELDFDELRKHSVQDKGRQGIIVSGRVTDKEVELLEQIKMPFVILGNYFFKKRVHMVGTHIEEAIECFMATLVEEGAKRVLIFVEDKMQDFESFCLYNARHILMELGLAPKDIIVVETGEHFKNMQQVVESNWNLWTPDTRIVTFEKHCSEVLLSVLRTHDLEKTPSILIHSFINAKPRFVLPGLRYFNLGIERCGELAVSKLIELSRSPDIPYSKSYVYSRGWVEESV